MQEAKSEITVAPRASLHSKVASASPEKSHVGVVSLPVPGADVTVGAGGAAESST